MIPKTQIEMDAEIILKILGEAEQSARKNNPGPFPCEFDPHGIQEATGLTSQALNDAIELLEEKGHVEVRKELGRGNSPFKCTEILLTTKGRQEYQRLWT